MSKEVEQRLLETNFFPKRLASGITDPDYLESLRWGKGIKVVNYLPNEKIDTRSFVSFRNNYLLRQTGLIKRLELVGNFIAENDLQKPADIQEKHKKFLREFVLDVGTFFSRTLPYSLKAKQVEIEMGDKLSQRYPHLDKKIFLTPSLPYTPIIRDFKLAEYTRGENDDFVFMFCAGNKVLADRQINRLDIEEEKELREEVRGTEINKGYAMLGRPDIKLLDDILTIDHTLEGWLWRGSLATAPLFHIYNIMQESTRPSGSFIKDNGYVFDLKIIREEF